MRLWDFQIPEHRDSGTAIVIDALLIQQATYLLGF